MLVINMQYATVSLPRCKHPRKKAAYVYTVNNNKKFISLPAVQTGDQLKIVHS